MSAIATLVALAVLVVRVPTTGHPNGALPNLHESRPLFSIFVPIMMFATGTAVGAVGAIAGKVFRALPKRT